MMNFNNAELQNSFDLIPANTIAKARLVLKPGNDFSKPMLTRSKSNSDTAYLNCEFIILEGLYAKRKIFDKIGIEGNDVWVNMGKTRIRAILESAKRINPKDMTETAIQARQINSFDELNGLDVVIKIGVEHDKSGVYNDKNRVAAIITPEHFRYNEVMNHSDDIPF